jgi:hypothetical protein
MMTVTIQSGRWTGTGRLRRSGILATVVAP